MKLEQRRRELIMQLLSNESMIRGSFGRVHRKCGRSNCWCVEGKGHPIDRINFSDGGRSRTKAIPEADIEWAKQVTANYKRFRKARQSLREIEQKINTALDQFEAKQIAKTARKRNYET